jgi:ribosomal protein S18 acetylase RimI-like enzyme
MVAEYVTTHAPAFTVQLSRLQDRAAIYDILITSGLFGKADAECVDEMFTSTWKALEADPDADTYRWLTAFETFEKFEFEGLQFEGLKNTNVKPSNSNVKPSNPKPSNSNPNSNCLGFACFGTESLTHNTWDLFWVCVRPEARGKGVARALMQEVITQARTQGGRLMVIYTSSTAPYAPARALYESQGFVRTAVVPEYYNVGDDLYIYSRRLRD